jgi:hypothetical protein
MLSENKKSEKRNPTSSIWIVLLGAGLLGFIGGILGELINWKKEDQLTSKEFQYGLVKDIMSVPNSKARNMRAKFYFETGLIDNKVVNLDLYALTYSIGKERGEADKSMAEGILGAIRVFYMQERKVPVNLNQLDQALNIKTQLDYFKGDVHYKATGPKAFTLQFYGADAVLYTDDDKKYSFSNLNIQ